VASDGWSDDEGTARWRKKIGDNPTDRGKTGTKRSLLTDGQGIPLGIEVSGVHRHDSQLVEATLQSIPIQRPMVRRYHQQHLCLDAAYVGDEVAAMAQAFRYTLHVRPRGEGVA
jgi:hypothetical protein